MKNIFLDTNIILDFLDKKRPLHTKAEILIKKLIIKDYNIYISEDMLSTIYYIGNDKEKILNFFKTILNRWSVAPYGSTLILEAISLCKQNKQDLEDTMQCLCAKKYRCTHIVTEDKKFVNCGIKIVDYSYIDKI